MRKTGLVGSVLLIGILNESILASSQPTKVAGSSCQCKLEYNVISCQSNVITNFPADLINSCPEFIDKFDQVEGDFSFRAKIMVSWFLCHIFIISHVKKFT